MTRSVLAAESETLRGIVTAMAGLMVERTTAMSKYEYLANLTEIATSIAEAKKTSADDIFKTLASLPRDKVPEMIKRML